MEKQVKEILISTNSALSIIAEKAVVSISLPTLINWAQTYKIGKKVGGRWWIDEKKLIIMLKEGNPDAETT